MLSPWGKLEVSILFLPFCSLLWLLEPRWVASEKQSFGPASVKGHQHLRSDNCPPGRCPSSGCLPSLQGCPHYRRSREEVCAPSPISLSRPMGKGMTSFSNVLQLSWKCERSQKGPEPLVSLCRLYHGPQLAGQQFPGWPFQELVVCGQTRAPLGTVWRRTSRIREQLVG